MDLESFGEAGRVGWLEGLVQAGQRVDVEVVHDQHDNRRVRVAVGQAAKEVRHVDRRAVLGHFDEAAPSQRLDRGEDVGGAAALVLVVDTRGSAASRRDGHAGVLEQLLARFVETDLRAQRVVGPVIDFEHIRHGVNESGAVLKAWFRFFETTLDRARADRVEHLELDELVGEQRDRPARPSGGRRTARDADELRLGRALELARPRGIFLRFSLQAGHQAALAAAPPHPLDGGDLRRSPGPSAHHPPRAGSPRRDLAALFAIPTMGHIRSRMESAR